MVANHFGTFIPSPKLTILVKTRSNKKVHVVRVPACKVGARLFENVPYKQQSFFRLEGKKLFRVVVSQFRTVVTRCRYFTDLLHRNHTAPSNVLCHRL